MFRCLHQAPECLSSVCECGLACESEIRVAQLGNTTNTIVKIYGKLKKWIKNAKQINKKYCGGLQKQYTAEQLEYQKLKMLTLEL